MPTANRDCIGSYASVLYLSALLVLVKVTILCLSPYLRRNAKSGLIVEGKECWSDAGRQIILYAGLFPAKKLGHDGSGNVEFLSSQVVESGGG